jgi:ABC-type Fe3+/spermidine/putrescine transport system ATPase subunit
VFRSPEFPQDIIVRGQPGDRQPATIAVRPEDIEAADSEAAGSCGVPATIADASYLGDHYRYRVAAGAAHLLVHSRHQLASGPVMLRIPPGVATFVD